jgi:hypothetical protein
MATDSRFSSLDYLRDFIASRFDCWLLKSHRFTDYIGFMKRIGFLWPQIQGFSMIDRKNLIYLKLIKSQGHRFFAILNMTISILI